MKKICGECFKNLGVGTRFKIYCFLEEKGEKFVSDITSYVKLKQPTVSYHLNEMLQSGIVKRRNEGKRAFYSVNKFCPHSSKECIIHNYA